MNLKFLPLIASLLSLALISCTSRYRNDLFVGFEHQRQKAKVNGTQYITDATLNLDHPDLVVPGVGSCLIVTATASGRRASPDRPELFSLDETLVFRLLIEPPVPLTVQTITLTDSNSVAELIGRYAVVSEDKLFRPDSGLFVIDSVTNKFLFGSIRGFFSNRNAYPLTFDGKIKAKIRE